MFLNISSCYTSLAPIYAHHHDLEYDQFIIIVIILQSRGSESSEDIPPTAVWDNSKAGEAQEEAEESPVVFNIPHSVMTCPGRLRQKGLDGIWSPSECPDAANLQMQ